MFSSSSARARALMIFENVASTTAKLSINVVVSTTNFLNEVVRIVGIEDTTLVNLVRSGSSPSLADMLLIV